eukprot:COSAG06_NODE_10461_length_1678_cov_3.784674_2_plen_110_part_00
MRIGVEKDVRRFPFTARVPGADGDAAGDRADAAGEAARNGGGVLAAGGRGRANCALARGADGSVVGKGRGVEVIPGAVVASERGRARALAVHQLIFWIVAWRIESELVE